MKFRVSNTCVLSLLIASFCSCVDCANYGSGVVSCTTWERQSGVCKTLPQCRYAKDIIKKYGVQSTEAQNILGSTDQCGFAAREPNVCCAQISATVGDRNTADQKGYHVPNKKPSPEQNPPNNHLLLLPSDCGTDESNRIIGGEAIAMGEFPWMALLEYQQDQTTQTALACGGTLISKRYVLTAAHCILNTPSYMHLKNVRLGEHDVNTDPDCARDGANGRIFCSDRMLSVPIEKMIIHQSYNIPQLFHNDIALLRLAYDVPFTRFVRPICLPSSGSTDSPYWSAGWGATDYKQSSNIKLKVRLLPVDLNQCAAKFKTKRVVLGDSQICAGGRAGKDTCKGDSGGPLMKQVQAIAGPNRWVIDGVVSIGQSPCGLPGWPGVYTKVHDYVRWIVRNMEP